MYIKKKSDLKISAQDVWTCLTIRKHATVSSSQRMHHIGTGKQEKSQVYGFCKIEFDWKSILFPHRLSHRTGSILALAWHRESITLCLIKSKLDEITLKEPSWLKNKNIKKEQCSITWSNLSLSPGSLWCTSSRAGSTGTPSLTGWSCRQSCHPRSSCLFPDPSPCPEDAVPEWTRAWPGGEDAGGAWLCWEDPIGFGLCSGWGLLSAPGSLLYL